MSGRFRILSVLSITALVAVGGWFVWRHPNTPEPGPFTYTAARVASPPAIDGDLSDWADVPRTRLFVRSDGKAFAKRPCTAALAWDDRNLYVAFDAADDDVLSPHTERDDDLWTKDVVEIYLDPGADGLNYYEFQVSPAGVVFDALFPKYRHNLARSRRWNARGLTAAARIHSGGYTAELAIPFRALRHAPSRRPKPGDAWRMNLYRIDIHPDETGDYTAWTPPIVGDFHALDRFGTLVFGD